MIRSMLLAALLTPALPAQQMLAPVPVAPQRQTPAAKRQQSDHQFLARRGISWEAYAHPRTAVPSQAGGRLQAHVTSSAVSLAPVAPEAPTSLLQRARQQHKALLAGSAAAGPIVSQLSTTVSQQTWQPIGPVQTTTAAFGAVTGRVTSLAVNPSDASGNTVYLGSTGGGVWKSTNAAGAAGSVIFTPLTDNLAAFTNNGGTTASLSIGALSVSPASSNVILAGTGDPNDALDSYYGVGILRSTDAGNSWTLIGGSKDGFSGGLKNYNFTGQGFAGFAWSSSNTNLVVAAVSQSVEGVLVNAVSDANAQAGLYYSLDAGQTWYLGIIEDQGGAIVQTPNRLSSSVGNAATAVVWNPVRQRFYAAVRFHGYYESTDGITWVRLANQPGVNLTTTLCPTNPSTTGSTACPIFRGALAVQPMTGDLFALTTDSNNQDQGLFQDVCSATGRQATSCNATTVTFGHQIASGALENGSGDPTIPQADYNLVLSAAASQQDTILFAGTEDVYRCSLANSCAWRNTTNIQTCSAAMVAPSQHAIDSTFSQAGLLYFANDGGLWRTTDTVAQTGPVCATTDASHYQNLNAGIGSLAEINHFSISSTSASLVLAGMGEFGTVGSESGPAQAGTGAWQQLLTGEATYSAIDPANPQNWYTDSGSGVNIHSCTDGAACNAAAFGGEPVIGSAQVEGDVDAFFEGAPWILDPLNSANIFVGTCRVWRGPSSGGSGWSASNILSPMLDGDQQPFCNGNAQLRTIAAGGSYNSAAGGEQVYAGMAGPFDGGSIDPGHLYSATVPRTSGITAWADLYRSPVTNAASALNQFNPGGFAISSIAVDPHDATGETIYATVEGFAGNGINSAELYGSTDGGAHWLNLSNSLPNAPANSVVVDPNIATTVYVALDTGVYYTQNIAACSDPTQQCWAVYGSGLPNAPVTDLQIYAAGANSVLEASTYGRGIWALGLSTLPPAQSQGTLTSSSFTFPGQQVNTSSSAATFTLANTGTTAMAIAQIAPSGDYAETDDCGQTLAAGASCSIQVTFIPLATGDRPGSLTVTANTADGKFVSTLDGTGLAAALLSAAPSSLVFPSTVVGVTSSAQTVIVTNTGGEPVQVGPLIISSEYQLTASTCSGTLAPAASCSANVTFTPVAPGDRTGLLSIPGSAEGSSTSVPLDGAAVAPATLSLTPSALAFASTAVGASSPAQSITVRNTGGVTLQLQSPTITSDYFIGTNTCTLPLAPGATCVLQIAFTPVATGSRPGLLTLPANVPGGALTATLSGTGLAPATLTFTPASLTFPATAVGSPSAAQSMTLKNTGSIVLQIQVPTFVGDYHVIASTCGLSLGVNASCVLQIAFTPTATGDRSQTLIVPANVAQGRATASLDGTGLTPASLSVAPGSLSFPVTGQGSVSSAQSVTLTSNGGVAVAFGSPSATGDFGILSSTCGETLAIGSSCALQVVFSPTAPGARTGLLTIPANIATGAAAVALAGAGVAPANVTFTPSALTFSAIASGTASAPESVTVTSSGGVPARLDSSTVSGDYQISATTCTGLTLAPGGTCQIQVLFHPNETGDETGQLQVNGNMVGGQGVLQIDSTGLAPGDVSFAPGKADFGSVLVAAHSTAVPFTLTNSGGVDVPMQLPVLTGDLADYTITADSCGTSIAAGASCTLQLVFTPTAAGPRPAQLSFVQGTGADATTLVATLNGTGLNPGSLAFTPGTLTFASQLVATTSAAQAITVSNTGDVQVNLQPLVLTGDYQASSTCGNAVAPAAQCSLQVTFTPTIAGSRPGTLTLPSDALNTPAVATLTGTGLAQGTFSLAPSSLSFPSTLLGVTSAPMTIVAANSGDVAVQLQALNLTGAGSADYRILANSCGSSLAAHGTCTLQVALAPSISGDRSAVLSLPGAYSGSPASVTLDGSGLTPGSLALQPFALTFAQTIEGTTTSAQTATLTNTGGSTLTLQTPVLTAGYKVTATDCGGTLNSGSFCQINVAFAPTTAGEINGSLTVLSTGSTATAQIALSGLGVAAAHLSFTPAALAFGTLEEYTSSVTAQIATLSNTGGLPATLQLPVVTGNYSIAANRCGTTLAVNSTCTIALTLKPTSVGDQPGSLSVSTVDMGTTASVALDGTSTAPPSLFLLPTAVTFNATVVGVTTAAQNITISNTGGTVMQLQPPTITGDFAISANTCKATLAANSGCTISITFSPTIGGIRTGLFTISNGTETESATLSGTGLSASTDTLSVASLSFPSTLVGSVSPAQSVTLTNSGGATLASLTTQVTGPFTATNNCGPSLGGQLSCAIAVKYVPTGVGVQTGVLTVADAMRTQTVLLSGDGAAPPTAFASPNTLSFGSYALGVASPAQTVTFTNNSPASLAGVTLSVTGDAGFALASSNCGSTLEAGASCQASVIFTPQQAVNSSGQLTLASLSLPAPLAVSLSGTGEDFELSVSGSSTDVITVGQTASYHLVVTPVGTSSGTLTFTCAGAPANATCTVNPASVTVAGGATGSLIVTVATTGATSSMLPPGRGAESVGRRSGRWLGGASLALLLPFAFRRKARRVFAALLVAAALTLAPTGCGVHASGGSSSGTGTAAGATPTGTYTLTVTGAFPGAQRTVSLTLTLQ